MDEETRHQWGVRGNLLCLVRLWDVPLAVAGGALLFLAAAYWVIDVKRAIPPYFERIITSKAFVEACGRAGVTRDRYVLGTSIAAEGLDARIVDRELDDGRETFNMSWIGSIPRDWAILLPALNRARPSMVVMTLDLHVFCRNSTQMDAYKIPIAGWWRAFDANDIRSMRGILSEEEIAALRAPRPLHLLRMRTLPMGWLEATVRARAREALHLEGHTQNFKAPWVRTEGLTGQVRRRSIRRRQALIESLDPAWLPAQIEHLAGMIDYLRRSGCEVVVVISPVNPEVVTERGARLKAAMRQGLSDLAAEKHVLLLDHADLLPAEMFADVCHATELGRQRWSRQLGQDLARHLRER